MAGEGGRPAGARPFDLTGKVALISGGAGPLARSIALALARAGADLAVHLPAESVRGLDRELEAIGRRLCAYEGDLTRPEAADRLIGQVGRDLSGLDIAVCLSARPALVPIVQIGLADWEGRTFGELRETFLVDQAAARAMVRQGYGGRLLHVQCSAQGLRGENPPSPGSARDGALIGLTRRLAVELAGHDINVNAVLCGAVEPAGAAGEDDSDRRHSALAGIPKGRFAHPEDVAALVAFLASDEADYLTGGTYSVDGGASLL